MGMNYFCTALLLLAAGLTVRAEFSPTNRPCPGVAVYSETRTDPPTRIFVTEVDLSTPGLQFRVAPGGPDPDGDGPWQTTLMRPTSIAMRENFALVVNGDFFEARGIKDAEGTNSAYRADVWGSVHGPAVTAGKSWAVSTNVRPALIVHSNSTVTIESRARSKSGDAEVLGGNTLLVVNGAIVPHTNKTRHPRTAAGLTAGRKKLILLVADGRKPTMAVGMNYDELAAEMLRLGCREAMNLDGGGSSLMAVREEPKGQYRILNAPSDGRERPVANVFGIVMPEKKLEPETAPK